MKIDVQPLIEKFNSLNVNARYGVFAAFVLMVVALDYALIIRFQLGGLHSVEENIRAMSTDTARVKTDRQRIEEIKKGADNMRVRQDVVSGKVRSTQEVPAILEEIARIANTSGVSIDQLAPSKDAQESLNGPDGKYYALPIVVQAHAGYHMFGQFLSKLESGRILFMVQNLRMEGNDNSRVVNIQATLKVVLADKPPQAPGTTEAVQADAFMYNDHGKRDPFLPLVSPAGVITAYDQDMSSADLVLEGIVADAKGKNLAIINGKVVKVADMIGPWYVESVAADRVELSKGQEHFTLKLKKGGF